MRRPREKKALDPVRAADSNAAHTAAIALLAGRDHSTADISRKLEQRGYSSEAVAAALTRLVQANTLDDARYGQNFARYRSRRGQGPARIRNDLRRSGLKDEQIDLAVKSGEEVPDFIGLASQARSRKFGSDLPKDWKDRAKQARFLQYRGFSTDHIRAVLKGAPDESDEGADQTGEPDPS
jgi:regulatory protein